MELESATRETTLRRITRHDTWGIDTDMSQPGCVEVGAETIRLKDQGNIMIPAADGINIPQSDS